MRQEEAFFEGRETELLYIAKRLADATRLEGILTENGIDFAVEPDEYHGGFIFRRTRIGAFFYVLADALEPAASVMRERGYKPFSRAEPH